MLDSYYRVDLRVGWVSDDFEVIEITIPGDFPTFEEKR